MKEIFKIIPFTNGFYSVSNYGRVRSNTRIITKTNGIKYTCKEKMLKIATTKAVGNTSYNQVVLVVDLKPKTYTIHRLVALTFLDNPYNLNEVNHKDGNGLNNCVSNLEWCTHSYNVKHSFDVLKVQPRTGILNGMAKLKEDDIRYIRKTASEKGRYYGRKELAKQFNVSEGTIKEIVTRRKNRWNIN